MNIIIHRGTKEVGGSCVEITCQDSCILIDFGIPLGFDFDEDIYGLALKVEFVRHLRQEVAFPSVDALQAQLLKDKEILLHR